MRRGWILGLAVAALLAVGAKEAVRVRQPVVAGIFYPAERNKLLAAVEIYTEDAKVPELPGRYVACITPHSAFPYSGEVAAHAFRALQPGQYDRVIVLASSHFAWFEGCSIPMVQFYRTPLGDVELDGPAIARLQMCPLIDTRAILSPRVKRFRDGSRRLPLHEVEYSIETVLPFLQARLGRFKLVPVVVGSFEGRDEKPDNNAIRAAAEALREIIDDRTFVVASTDLTHFGNVYGFRPFEEPDPERIEALDVTALEFVMHRDLPGFQSYIEETGNRICGEYVLELLMYLVPKGTESVLLDYATSGGTETSVSYASVAFFNRHLPPAEPRPLTAERPRPRPTVAAPPLLPHGAPRARPAPASPREDEEKKGILRRLRKSEP